MKHTGESGRRRSAGRRVLNILLVFLLIFLILVLIGMGYTLAMLGKMNYVGEQEATFSPAELENYMEQSKDEEIPEGEDAVRVAVSFFLPNTMDGDDTAEVECVMTRGELKALVEEMDRLCEKFPDRA